MSDERDATLCPACGKELPADLPGACPGCGAEPLVNGRYALERFLGSGGQGRTFLGRDRRTGVQVAVKELSVSRSRDWKTIDLFRRSAEVVARLEHPGTPKLVDCFEVDRAGVTFYYLVQEYIDGESFAAQLAGGRRFDEKDARAIAREALGILGYLHGRTPPVVHRDVKPSNLMCRRDGRIALIDFDLVRQHERPAGGSTLAIGTPGYAPLEQYVGEAVPATDLYALGATLVALLSRKEPAMMLDGRTARLAFRPHVNVGDSFAAILERLLEPDVARRYSNAAEVLADLDKPVVEALPPAPPPPSLPKRRGPRRRFGERLVKVFTPPVVGTAVTVLAIAGFAAYTVLRGCREEWAREEAEEAKRAADMSDSTNWKTLEDAFRYARENPGKDIRHLVTAGAPDFARLDPADALPWAIAVARRWQSDAVLVGVDAVDAGADGLFDVVSNDAGRVTYEFASPGRIKGYYANLAESVEPVDHALRLELQGGSVGLYLTIGQPPGDAAKPVAEPGCPLAMALAAFAADPTNPGPVEGADADLHGYDPWAWRIVPQEAGAMGTRRIAVDTCRLVAASECGECGETGAEATGQRAAVPEPTEVTGKPTAAELAASSPPGDGWATLPSDGSGWVGFVRDGKIVEAQGEPPEPAGATVQVRLSVDPAPGGLNCRVLLSCAGTTLYGAGTSGYNQCAVEGGVPATALDSYPADRDGDPMMRLDLPGGTVTVGGGSAGGYLATFTLAVGEGGAMTAEGGGGAAIRRRATLASIEGRAPAAVGDECELRVLGPFARRDCRFVVGASGRTPIYGAGESGYNVCEWAGGEMVEIHDTEPTSVNGDPIFRADLVHGTLQIEETVGPGESGAFLIRVVLDGFEEEPRPAPPAHPSPSTP